MNRERWVLNQAKNIRLENSRIILGGYKLNYDHVVDMHNTQIQLDKKQETECLQKSRKLDLKIQNQIRPICLGTNKQQET